MSTNNSFELYVKNPLLHTPFPLFALDCNNNISIPPRQRFHEIHWHSDIQLTYVLEGKISIKTMNQKIILKKGQMIFINKNVLHQINEAIDSHYRSLIFPDTLISFTNQTTMQKQVTYLLEQSQLETYIFLEATAEIKDLDQIIFLNQSKEFKEYYLALKLANLIYQVMANIDATKPSLSKENHLGLQECLCFIHLHYHEDISLEDIASYGNMSAGHCGRLFQQILETTPYEYLINYRIKKSLELLANKQTTISTVAIEVGFNGVSHYIQSFKKRMKITPKQYQKLLFNQKQQA